MDETGESFAAARGRPLPLVGVLLGGVVLAAGVLIVPRVAPALPLVHLAGGGALAGFVLWLAALAGGLRRGASWWIVAALALLVAGGALAGYGAARIGHAGSAADASTFAELEANPDGTPILPSNPVRGPMSALYADLVRAGEREARDYGARMGRLNAGTLNSPYLLAQSPGLLGDCGAIGRLEPEAAAASARQAERRAALTRAVETAELSDAIRRGIGMIAAPGGDAELLAEERGMLKATGELCRLLAKRSWSNDGGFFGFVNGADRAAFTAINARRVAIEAERKRIRTETKRRFEEGRELVRAALS